MNRCPVCCDELPANANFCGKCGFPLRKKARPTERILSVQLLGKSSTVTMPENLPSKRSIVVNMNEQKKSMRNKRTGFWIIISLLICLIGGLGAYIASTYLPNPASGATRVSSASKSVQPSLSLREPLSPTVKHGQTLLLHGEEFRSNDSISFLLDSAFPIKDKNNRDLSIRASSKGSFEVSIPVQGSDWSGNTHYIEGIDSFTQQRAYLTVVVSPASISETSSQNLALSARDGPVTSLTFQAVAGQGNPDRQYVTLTNISGSPLSWSATASADHNLSWLVIDDNHQAGNLDSGGTDVIGVSALITALKSNSRPYVGQIVFTINGQEQLTLPVDLQVADAQSEIVFTPNPAVAVLGAGNTCEDTTFTLINIGQTFINWTLVPYDNTKDHVQFIAGGQAVTQGVLASSGTPGDTQILKLQCNRVLAGNSYRFTMYAGNTNWLVTITIQA